MRTLMLLLIVVLILPSLFPNFVNEQIDDWIDDNINGSITFTSAELTFFKHFPSLTLTLENVMLKGSKPFENDTLIMAKDISLGINLMSIIRRDVTIDKIILDRAFINIQVDAKGLPNYDIAKTSTDTTTNQSDTSTNGASLGIKLIIVKNSRIAYNDRSLPMTFSAQGLNYKGSGDLSKDIFDLNTHIEIKSFDFTFNNTPYVLGKKINADLITEINTQSLSFYFKKNKLLLNTMPMEFNGHFGFLKDGYDMDFHIDSHEKDIDELITALPPEYGVFFNKTQVDGIANIQVALTGKYVAKDSIMPDVSMNIKIRDGYIKSGKEPYPIRDLYLDMAAKLPGMNMDSLAVNIDSMHFKVADGYFNSVIRVKGVKAPYIYAKIKTEIDLEKWHKALGLKKMKLKGFYTMDLLAEGKYEKDIIVVKKGKFKKKLDTVITSIPRFKLNSTFKGGYFKSDSLPEALERVSFHMEADCPDSDYKHTTFLVNDLDIASLSSSIKGAIKLGNEDNFPIDADITANLHLEDIQKFYPIKDLVMRGDMKAEIHASGDYLPEKKIFPILTVNLDMKDGYIKTKAYPNPIENIQINAHITDSNGTLQDVDVAVSPLSFTFEGEPFAISGTMNDFTNVDYDLKLNGKLDLGKIYQMFKVKGDNITGILTANVSISGKQSDLMAGNYDNLTNDGTIRFLNVDCTSTLFPKPFIINSGAVRFDDEKLWIDTIDLDYANSTMVLNGAFTNFVDYFMKPGSMLKGEFDLTGENITVDDFMLADTTVPVPTPSVVAVTTATTTAAGVVVIPNNLDLTFKADIDKITYKGMVFKQFEGLVYVRHDSLLVKETAFNLLDAPIEMDIVYTAINPKKAYFDYHINAKDFDIQKAYKNIKIFHDMATAAEHTDGLISIDYQLSGNLNSAMSPIYQSIKGGGTISAEKLKMHGFKLFNSIGKESGQDSLNGENDADKVSIKSTIANNIINIERTKMKMAGFRARFEGQVGFDKKLDLKFKLGLPPRGLISIPMTITGSGEDPKIHVGRGKNDSVLTEAADSAEVD